MTPTPWRLAPDVHVARSGRDLVFLDVGQGSYFCLASSADKWTAAANGAITLGDPHLAEQLLAGGLIRSSSADHGLAGGEPLPAQGQDLGERELFSARRRPTAARTAKIAIRTAIDGALVFSRRGFGQLIAMAREERRSGGEPRPSAAMIEAVNAFQDALVWVPRPGECLFRSFTLLRHLRREGFDARWVFGVRTWPFHAHCWLQAGDTVLEDTLDRLLPFTPILAV
jgi:hypothetical protein